MLKQTNCSKILYTIIGLITYAICASSFAAKADTNRLNVFNQTASHQIRIKEGLFFKTDQILHPTEKTNVNPTFGFNKLSIEYYDTNNKQFIPIPNCKPDFYHGHSFDITVSDEGKMPRCNIKMTRIYVNRTDSAKKTRHQNRRRNNQDTINTMFLVMTFA